MRQLPGVQTVGWATPPPNTTTSLKPSAPLRHYRHLGPCLQSLRAALESLGLDAASAAAATDALAASLAAAPLQLTPADEAVQAQGDALRAEVAAEVRALPLRVWLSARACVCA